MKIDEAILRLQKLKEYHNAGDLELMFRFKINDLFLSIKINEINIYVDARYFFVALEEV